MRKYENPISAPPEVQLLSNGRYHTAVSTAGGGYSHRGDLAVTRWREDATRDCWGTFIYLRDNASGDCWSAAYQPTLKSAEQNDVIFAGATAEFRRRQNGVEAITQIWVSPEDDLEVRRVVLTNRSAIQLAIELTTYAEVVLTNPGADSAHPVFSNLFVQTEFIPQKLAILATRRPRAEGEARPWLLHGLVTADAAINNPLSCETDRARFIGRGRTPINPVALETKAPLSNTVGSVLDPIVALRRTFSLTPNQPVAVSLILGVTDSREEALALIEKYQAPRQIEQSLDLARAKHDSAEGVDQSSELSQRLASAVIYANPALRAAPETLARNQRGQPALWPYGISGDFPIVFLSVTNPTNLELARELVRAHRHWQIHGLATDLILLVDPEPGGSSTLQDQIASLITTEKREDQLDKRGGIFVRTRERVSPEDVVLFETCARVVLSDQKGTLAEQLTQAEVLSSTQSTGTVRRSGSTELAEVLGEVGSTSPEELHAAPGQLVFDNGTGGFTADGREYVITLRADHCTPAPWVNVIANSSFGTAISESGSAYTWAENSHELRLTPWNNDPVTDTSGEALYIRDDETGEFWSPTPLPIKQRGTYSIRHGFGYSVFEFSANGIASELTVYVAVDATIKFSVLKLRNVSGRQRRISVFGYWEWVLGDLRQKSLLHVRTEVEPATGALLARNAYNSDFSEWIAVVDVDGPAGSTRALTGDRQEFLGQNGSLAKPAALLRGQLSGKTGPGLDPGGALQVSFELPDKQEREIPFRLGAGRGRQEVSELIARFRGIGSARTALEKVVEYWERTLGTVQVETADRSVDFMVNGWLLYQVLSARFWGRTGFYQSGGAFGFRDQLQDVMALVHAEPALVREHLLRAAAHQFREGDVLHWWHPPAGRGVRTRVSDDYLFLPYVASRYVTCTGDQSVLNERVTFLEGRPLNPGEESYYDLPKRSEDTATLYEHCVRAIEHGLRFGEHGIPLMGSGDWNDGMNLVGIEGRGESVWLAFFLYDVLIRFAALAQNRNDTRFAERCRTQARQLQENIEKHTWDGEWYRRAYFDNGGPLGSHLNSECQIDSLPQSWSIISGAGDSQRSRQAMESVNKRLVRREAKLIQLFDPPFDQAPLHPGYIKGYVPGVRENGGQYTHGAVWAVTAFALEGDHERAWELASLLNPIQHALTAEQVATYKVEPYVIAADIYWVPPHTGRGGWTWYTGSAGWMYRLLVETLLGLNLENNRLRLQPGVPKNWKGYKARYRHGRTTYEIAVVLLPDQLAGNTELFLDGQKLADLTIPLTDDEAVHQVEARVRS
jgi:cellobiose phosphorylase